MTFDPKSIDLKKITVPQAIAEGNRELQLRLGVYGKWLEANKITPEKAEGQFGGMMKLVQLAEWIQKVGTERIATALHLLEFAEKEPSIMAKIINDPAISAVLATFPEAKVAAIRKIGEKAA